LIKIVDNVNTWIKDKAVKGFYMAIASMRDTRTLIVVDDSAADRKIYRRFLLKDPQNSYDILEADSAEEGLALCQQMQCHVVLLDFCLPDMTGLEFLDRLQEFHVNFSAPVIMLTGHGDEAIAVQAIKRGAQDYLVKQYLQPDVLQIAVRNAIKQSRLQAQLSKTKERQRLIATTALRIRESLNLEQILHTAISEVQQLLQCDGVLVCQFEADKEVIKESGKEVIKEAINKKRKISQIYEAGCNNCSYLKEEDFEGRSDLVVPINISSNNSNSKVWGLLIAHHSSNERQWQSDEVEILNEVAVQLAIAIQQAELLAQTQAALEKEKQLNTFKSHIIATVSHEYRTPLASILASASTLKQYKDKLDKLKQERFLEIIEDKARHLSKLVDDMLLVNQFEMDKTKFKPIPIDLLQFFSELMEQQQQIIGNKHELIFRITGNNKGFWGDRGLLRQIFVNLISNAIKYSPDGGNIEFYLIGKSNEIIFHIRDDGIGIPTDEQENLFQSFSRGSNVGTIPGTGLGLVITKSCVELHGGEITLSSQIGKGTNVTVCLPKRPV
jgi:signal transduction histidine kinase/FixJ family two-component response regulator